LTETSPSGWHVCRSTATSKATKESAASVGTKARQDAVFNVASLCVPAEARTEGCATQSADATEQSR
jgi:hypothetical protein